MRKLVKGTLVMLLAATLITTVFAIVYWSRTIQLHLNVVGIQAELYRPDYQGYDEQIIVTNFVNNKVCLTILLENYAHEMWLNCSLLGAPAGMTYEFIGDYVHVYEKAPWGYYPEGTPFDVTGYHQVDKTKMMYGMPGWGLEILFSWDGGTALPGGYDVEVLFQMGFV
jgi:hypothetical protein